MEELRGCRLLQTTCRHCGKVTTVAYVCFACGRINQQQSPPDHACYECLANKFRLNLAAYPVLRWREIWHQAVSATLYRRYLMRGNTVPPFPLDLTQPLSRNCWVRWRLIGRRMIGLRG